MSEFYNYRTHKDLRRAGSYDIIPGLEGDMNFTVHEPMIIPEELHMHREQTDYFTVASGKVLFRLAYEDGLEEQFILGEDDAKTLVIPPGVWHGYVALEPSIMVFYISHKFDVNDEYKMPVDKDSWNLPTK